MVDRTLKCEQEINPISLERMFNHSKRRVNEGLAQDRQPRPSVVESGTSVDLVLTMVLTAMF